MNSSVTHPVVWLVGASDSAAHAGLQADIRTLHALDVHGATIVTAITAQNSQQVAAVFPVDPAQITAQHMALQVDVRPQAIKLGVVPNAAVLDELLPVLSAEGVPIICDPVRTSSTGQDLADAQQRAALLRHAQQIDLLTPNLPEALYLTGMSIEHSADIPGVAAALRSQGFARVWLKGGHWDQDESTDYISDYYIDAERAFWLTNTRLPQTNRRGTGCTAASAVTGFMAQGHAFEDAVILAQGYVHMGLQAAHQIGQGPGPVAQCALPLAADCLPQVTDVPWVQHPQLEFAEHPSTEMGLYAVVDDLEELSRMLRLAVPIVQLRIKDQPLEQVDSWIAAAVDMVQGTPTKLYINDYWQLAARHGAYGVHLGQEDLTTADLPWIAAQGLRLGLSTHCEYELQRALAVRPSYVALGPIFPTQSKVMRFGPQGLARLRAWRRYVDRPLVAIGGIHAGNIQAVWETGVDAVAMISGLRDVTDQCVIAYGRNC